MEEGSKPRCAGVASALRFCVIESSTVPRDMRRKSDGNPLALVSVGRQQRGQRVLPRSATWLKQNCGVRRGGCGRGCDIGGGGGRGEEGGGGERFQKKSASSTMESIFSRCATDCRRFIQLSHASCATRMHMLDDAAQANPSRPNDVSTGRAAFEREAVASRSRLPEGCLRRDLS